MALLGNAFYDPVVRTAMPIVLIPAGDFEEHAQPLAPDYALATSCAALHEMVGAADRSPAGVDLDHHSNAKADAFFVHSTTYMSRWGGNQPLKNAASDDEIDAWGLPAQASAFNGSCQVYAPRYRQATIASFFDTLGNGDQALDLALSDFARAFKNFLQTRNNGRPINWAGSQHLHQSITWTTDNKAAPATDNPRRMDFGAQTIIDDAVVGAQCGDGVLFVLDVASDNFDYMPFGSENYHRYDYSLFYMNARANAVARVNAFLDK